MLRQRFFLSLKDTIASRRILYSLAVLLLPSATAQAVPLRDLMQDKPQPQERVYKKVGDQELKLCVFKPRVRAGERRPALVWIHGGAWVAGDAQVFFPHARYSASRGAVGISIEYRLSKIGGSQASDCLADCKSAIRYIRSHARELGVNPTKIAVLGDSAGGHLAAALGTISGFDDPHDNLSVSARPDVMVLFNPILDMTEGDWIYFAVLGANPKQDKPAVTDAMLNAARSLSPTFHVQPGQPPTLLMQGLEDHVVNADQARQFAAKMKAAGNECELVLLPGARHAFVIAHYTAPEAVVVSAIRTADHFLAAHGFLQGEPTLEVSSPPAWEVPTPRQIGPTSPNTPPIVGATR